MTDIITTTADLAAACERFAQFEFVTVDTEFMRETTYWPKLCIIQIASTVEAVIIDAEAPGLDLAPFFALMADEKVMKVFHAARQDIEIVWHLGGILPHPIFDTQVAAMVCGFGESISYDQLVGRITGHPIDKSSRFTDWSRRPLTEHQIDYAIADVTHLRDVYLALKTKLERQHRSEWVREEMDILTSIDTYQVEPEHAWKRLKMRIKKPLQLAVLMEVAAWREREAQGRDVPRGRVLKDDAIYEIAEQHPTTPDALGRLRTIPKGFERSRTAEEILAAVKRATELPKEKLPRLPKSRPAADGNGAAVDLLKVLLKMTSEEHGVAARVIATVDELEAIAGDDNADVPPLHGWRRELFGEHALRLKRGEIALRLEGRRVSVVGEAIRV
ncbi:ribonuclease D [Kaistia dalseonensis]|uniref:Ribonuclease D n=1 Tax=Kaistia dalseonensis TaxID=410840 RepID=A0ABU0H0J7_9HYPH|nr:ribonuclease D [Kaistia dalseonensis]MCX5493269.1 ribonuclease D [Kaistia dalseonensis]MDQ0435826.1 ribonuclease D [Kaistia dalseonensis]